MLDLRQLSGVKTLEITPVWERTGEALNVTVGQDGIELREGKFGLYLMQRHEDGTASLVNLRKGVGRKETYQVAAFTASRDWSDDDGVVRIHKGDTTVMAY